MQEALLGDGLGIATKLQLAKAVVCRHQREGSWGRLGNLMAAWALPSSWPQQQQGTSEGGPHASLTSSQGHAKTCRNNGYKGTA